MRVTTLGVTVILATGFALSVQAQSAAAPARQAKTFEKKIATTAKLDYLLSLPADYGRSRKSWPLVLFLHGAKDTTVPLKRSEEMVEALKAAGATPKFTIYPDAGHDSWTATYDNPEFYQWLLAQKRTQH